MKCQNCGKREAIVEYTQIVDGNKLHLHLCEKCANEMKIGMDFMFDINDVFSTFFYDVPTLNVADQIHVVKCQNCGSTYNDFKNTGRLGCSSCYKTFENELDSVLKRIHGSNRHINNQPKSISNSEIKNINDEIIELKESLKKCIENEAYEEAAKIRDKIKLIEQKRGDDK